MTIAEIKGKLSPDRVHDRSEDLLTSDVFGTMQFVSDPSPFLAWLGQAVFVFDAERTLATMLPIDAPATTQMRFWPRFANRREPDVAILAEGSGGRVCLLVIEVKYESGLSNFDVDSTSGESDEKLTGHQLVDQMAGMKRVGVEGLCSEWFESNPSGEAAWAHLLITCDRSIPHEAYEQVSARYGSRPADYSPTGQPLPFWLSWHLLLPVLQRLPGVHNPTDRRLLDHLMSLLEYKQLGAISFRAFQPLEVPELTGLRPFWSRRPWFGGIGGTGGSEITVDSCRSWWRGK
jgi:hypothetical protein